MEIGKFYGTTAAMSILLDVPSVKLKTLSRLINNKVDYWIIQSFIDELKYLKSFLKDNVIVEYRDPTMRRLAVSVRASKTFYSQENPTHKPIHLLEESDIVEAEHKLMGAEKCVLNRIKSGESFIDLSPNETSMLQLVYDKSYNIDIYLKCLSINTFTEVTAFGEKVYRIANPRGLNVHTLVNNLFKKAQGNETLLEKVIAQCKQSVITLNLFISEEGFKDVDSKIKYVTFNEIFTKLLNSGIATSSDEPFIKMAHEMKLLTQLTFEDLKVLISYYRSLSQLSCDYLNNQLTLAYGNDIETYSITEQEYNDIFDKFDSFGLIGLNLYSLDFLKDMLHGISFNTEYKIVIEKDSNLAVSINEVSDLCNTLLPIGVDI